MSSSSFSDKGALEFNEQGETVYGEAVVFRRLTIAERKVYVGKQGIVSPFGLIGRVNGNDLELWKLNGRWREDEKPHPRDLAITADAHT